MKRATTAFLVLTLIVWCTSQAYGQSFEFGPKVGLAVATGDFGDVADDGFAYGFFADYYVNSRTSVELSFLRHVHDAGANLGEFGGTPDDILDDFAILDDGDIEINEFTVSGVHRFATGRVKPFIVGGAGVYLTQIDLKGMREDVTTSVTAGAATEVTTSLADFTAEDNLTDFGLRGGGGVSIMVTGEISMGVEGVYTYIFGDFDSGVLNILGRLSYGF